MVHYMHYMHDMALLDHSMSKMRLGRPGAAARLGVERLRGRPTAVPGALPGGGRGQGAAPEGLGGLMASPGELQAKQARRCKAAI